MEPMSERTDDHTIEDETIDDQTIDDQTSDDQGHPASPVLDPSRFRQLMSRVPTSVAVVTARLPGDPDRSGIPVGMVIGTLTSVSLQPPLVGFFADEQSHTLTQLLTAGRIAFNLLTRESSTIIRAFSRPIGERFDGLDWSTTTAGTPYLDDALLVIEGDIVSTTPTGDHRLVLVEVWSALALPDAGGPMVFYAGELMGLQHDTARQPVWQLGRYERR